MGAIELTEFISPIILLACACVGYILHSFGNKILNSFIPIILAALGIGAAVGSLGSPTLPIVVTGMVSGLAACGTYEAFKNMLRLPATYAALNAAKEEITIPPVIEDETTEAYVAKHFN